MKQPRAQPRDAANATTSAVNEVGSQAIEKKAGLTLDKDRLIAKGREAYAAPSPYANTHKPRVSLRSSCW